MNHASNFKLKILTLNFQLQTNLDYFTYNTYIQYLKSNLNNQGFSIFIRQLMHVNINIEKNPHICINNQQIQCILFVYRHIFQPFFLKFCLKFEKY